jgi:hypothetical protein
MTNDAKARGQHEPDQAEDAPSPATDSKPHERASDPAGAVSNQNGEEAESGLREDGTHPEPRTDDRADEPERS